MAITSELEAGPPDPWEGGGPAPWALDQIPKAHKLRCLLLPNLGFRTLHAKVSIDPQYCCLSSLDKGPTLTVVGATIGPITAVVRHTRSRVMPK